MNSRLVKQLNGQDNADQAPTEAMLAGYAAVCRNLRTVVASWAAISAKALPGLNSVLGKSGVKAVGAAASVKAPECGEKAVR